MYSEYNKDLIPFSNLEKEVINQVKEIEEIERGNFVEYQKLSKKQKKRIDFIKRRSWGEIRPITRVSKLVNKYSRKRKNRDEE
jgi:hypothetical protein